MADTITAELLREIDRAGSSRETIAAIYRRGIEACHAVQQIAAVDWHAVNAALLRRYKPSGLNYIKALAWSTARLQRLDLQRKEVNSMNKNHEGVVEEQTDKPADQGSTEGAGQPEASEKGSEQKPAPEGD